MICTMSAQLQPEFLSAGRAESMEALQLAERGRDLQDLMHAIGRAARQAAGMLALAPSEAKRQALRAAAAAIRGRAEEIAAANRADVAEASAGGATAASLDRLRLDGARIES